MVVESVRVVVVVGAGRMRLVDGGAARLLYARRANVVRVS